MCFSGALLPYYSVLSFVHAFVLLLQLDTLISLKDYYFWSQDQMHIICIFIFLKYASINASPYFQCHWNFLSVLLPPFGLLDMTSMLVMYLRVRACVFQPIFTSHSFYWHKSYCKYFLNSMALQYILTFMVFHWASFYLLERVGQTEFLVHYFTKFSWYCCEKCWSPQGCHGTS